MEKYEKWNMIFSCNIKKVRQGSISMPATGECVEIGGVTSENKDIIMNINHDSKINRLHEIFHTFGFVDFNESERGYGIMNYPPYQPGKEDANSLINYHFLPIIYE